MPIGCRIYISTNRTGQATEQRPTRSKLLGTPFADSVPQLRPFQFPAAGFLEETLAGRNLVFIAGSEGLYDEP